MLMQAVQKGDSIAFEQIVSAYMIPVYRFIHGMVYDQTMAEDISQETFARLWTRAGMWSPKGRLKSWLLRIAHNLCVDELRSARNKNVHLNIDMFGDSGILEVGHESETPEHALQKKQVSQEVRLAIKNLPERQKSALMLVYFSYCSNCEAANIMDVSVEALESLLSRGKRGLRNALSKNSDRERKVNE
jgi:RNA polymerase sigma-70 factor (ECF subfamily)